jgi:MFS family permease
MPTDTTRGPSAAADGGASETQMLAAVSAAHLVSHVYLMVLPVLLPLLKQRLDVSFLDLGIALTCFSVITGLTQAPMGFVVDRFGARPILVAGLVLGGLAFASLGLHSSYAWLIAVALLAGLANCVYHPADYALLADNVAEARMGRAFSVHTFAGFAGSALAPVILLALAGTGGLPTALVCIGLLGPITAVLFLLPSQSAASGRARAARAARSIARPASQSLASVVTPTVLGLTAFFTLLALANSAIFSFSVVALIAGHGISFAAANVALTAYLGCTAIGVLMGGALAGRTTRHGEVAAVGFGLAALTMLLVAILDLPAPAIIVAMGLSGIIFGLVQPARDMLVRRAAPPGSAGRVFGIVSTGFNIGGTVGPLLFGWLMDHGQPRWVFGAAVVFMAMTALFGVLEEWRGARRARPPSA